jgi:hypothetical protein
MDGELETDGLGQLLRSLRDTATDNAPSKNPSALARREREISWQTIRLLIAMQRSDLELFGESTCSLSYAVSDSRVYRGFFGCVVGRLYFLPLSSLLLG